MWGCKKITTKPSLTSVLGRVKPIIPQNIRGTLTLSDHNSIHMLRFIIILYKSCNRASFKHLGQLPPINYIYIVTFAPNLQRASFYSIIEYLSSSTTIKLLLHYNTYKWSYLSLRALLQRQEVIISLVPTTRGKHQCLRRPPCQ